EPAGRESPPPARGESLHASHRILRFVDFQQRAIELVDRQQPFQRAEKLLDGFVLRQIAADLPHPDVDGQRAAPLQNLAPDLRAQLAEFRVAQVLDAEDYPHARTKKSSAARLRAGLRSISPKSEKSAHTP